mmetsp:Transcript_46439/g.149211  ORF Transcript_46439/g.149211 Transcript_46439/m.149211 type:complete len:235 (-) Transcript_46439:2-706(-)
MRRGQVGCITQCLRQPSLGVMIAPLLWASGLSTNICDWPRIEPRDTPSGASFAGPSCGTHSFIKGGNFPNLSRGRTLGVNASSELSREAQLVTVVATFSPGTIWTVTSSGRKVLEKSPRSSPILGCASQPRASKPPTQRVQFGRATGTKPALYKSENDRFGFWTGAAGKHPTETDRLPSRTLKRSFSKVKSATDSLKRSCSAVRASTCKRKGSAASTMITGHATLLRLEQPAQT